MSEMVLIPPSELRSLITETVRHELQAAFKQPDKYLTREEAARLLRISVVTLSSWNHKGILKPLKIEGRVLYSVSSLENMIHQKESIPPHKS